MKFYGSVINRLAETRNARPEVGMGVTEYMWSDRHAYEIIEVKDDRHITVRALKSTIRPGTEYYEQDYIYESDPEARVKNLFLTNKGLWRERIGRSLGDTKFGIGVACEYRDPSF